MHQTGLNELFSIANVKYTKPVTYSIAETNRKEIQGTFYEPELQKTKQEVCRIEKVLKKRTRSDDVKWKGYSNDSNSWIPVSNLQLTFKVIARGNVINIDEKTVHCYRVTFEDQ